MQRPHIRTRYRRRTPCSRRLILSSQWIRLRLRVPGGRVFITSYLLDNLISFTAETALEWDMWYCSLVYCGRKKKENGGVWEGVEPISEGPAVTRHRRQVRDTWCRWVARSRRKGRRKACLGWVYGLILSLHPAWLGHVSPAASLRTAWNFELLFWGFETKTELRDHLVCSVFFSFGNRLSPYMASE